MTGYAAFQWGLDSMSGTKGVKFGLNFYLSLGISVLQVIAFMVNCTTRGLTKRGKKKGHDYPKI